MTRDKDKRKEDIRTKGILQEYNSVAIQHYTMIECTYCVNVKSENILL